jgi:hypothetical protein
MTVMHNIHSHLYIVGLGLCRVGASQEESRINQLRSQVDEVKAVVSDLFAVYV